MASARQTQRRSKQATQQACTCKRGSAEHSVKDDHAFLWEQAIFRYLPSRNPPTDQVEILHDWLVSKPTWCAKNGCNRLARGGPTHRWNITSTFVLYFTLLYLTLLYFTFFFLVSLYSPNGWTDLYAQWLKRRGLLQGSAFWGSRWYEFRFRVL